MAEQRPRLLALVGGAQPDGPPVHLAARLGRAARAGWPWAGSGHGRLPALLVGLTVVTGLVDAVSYLALGHVFVANMTGNVVFLGFALAGAPGLSVPASLAALGAFLLGALAGGRIAVRHGGQRGPHLRTATTIAALLVLLATLLAATFGHPVAQDHSYALIVPLAIAMGIQNATARRLAVPDLTTTVLTLTLTGVAADSRLAGGAGGHPARRLVAVTAMFAGALIGALLVTGVDLVLPLAIAAAVLAASALAAAGADRAGARHPATPPGDGRGAAIARAYRAVVRQVFARPKVRRGFGDKLGRHSRPGLSIPSPPPRGTTSGEPHPWPPSTTASSTTSAPSSPAIPASPPPARSPSTSTRSAPASPCAAPSAASPRSARRSPTRGASTASPTSTTSSASASSTTTAARTPRSAAPRCNA
jgi:uncharacterized membrane protein YoaK (UPF0700 family)